MTLFKAIYHNGKVELIEPPESEEMTEVLVIFPERKQKGIKKIGGLWKAKGVDYARIRDELKQLSRESQTHLLEELGDE